MARRRNRLRSQKNRNYLDKYKKFCDASRAAAALALAARRSGVVAPCGVFVFFSWEVFVVFLPVFWGEGPVSVVFSVARGRVVCRCASRSAAARLLWRFRAARRVVRASWREGARGVLRPPASVPGFPRFGLRWLASRSPVVCVRGAGVGGRRRSAFALLVPLFRRFRG